MAKPKDRPIGYGWADKNLPHRKLTPDIEDKEKPNPFNIGSVKAVYICCGAFVTVCLVALILKNNVDIYLENGSWKFRTSIQQQKSNELVPAP